MATQYPPVQVQGFNYSSSVHTKHQNIISSWSFLHKINIVLVMGILFIEARSTYGIKKGRVMFEIKIIKHIPSIPFKGFNAATKNKFSNGFFKEDEKCLVRVGWATQFAVPSTYLGCDHDSCGYESTGTRFYTGNYKKYGEAFGPGDVIRCCIDLDGHNKCFSFYKNGVFQGIAYRISSKLSDKTYYPAINIRNAEVLFNFGGNNSSSSELYPLKSSFPQSVSSGSLATQSTSQQQFSQSQPSTSYPQPYSQDSKLGNNLMSIPNAQNLVSREEIKITEYVFIGNMPEEAKEYEQVVLDSPPEAIFMVGLPASGKTTFAQNYVKGQNSIVLLGSYQIFEHIVENLQVTSLGQNLTTLMEISNQIFNKCLKLIAGMSKKSVLIDQSNVLLKARMQKLMLFNGFLKKAFILVLSDGDQRKRMLKRERFLLSQKAVYPKLCLESFRNLQENFILPTKAEGFDEIEYLEIGDEFAQSVTLMNNLVAESEIHPLLKPYDFKRVREARDVKEKNKQIAHPQPANQTIQIKAQQEQQFQQKEQVGSQEQELVANNQEQEEQEDERNNEEEQQQEQEQNMENEIERKDEEEELQEDNDEFIQEEDQDNFEVQYESSYPEQQHQYEEQQVHQEKEILEDQTDLQHPADTNIDSTQV